MSRGGRPPLSPADRRQERAIYLSQRELDVVKRRAAKTGLPVPEFMRQALSSGTIISSPTIAITQWSKLAPLASNINQIAARLNSKSGDLVSQVDLDSLADLDVLLREIRLRLLSVEPSNDG